MQGFAYISKAVVPPGDDNSAKQVEEVVRLAEVGGIDFVRQGFLDSEHPPPPLGAQAGNVVESHIALLRYHLKSKFPWRGEGSVRGPSLAPIRQDPLPWLAGMDLDEFFGLCRSAMEEVNQSRGVEGTREMKGFYPLIFSSAVGYRYDLPALRDLLRGRAGPNARAEADEFALALCNHLRIYPFSV